MLTKRQRERIKEVAYAKTQDLQGSYISDTMWDNIITETDRVKEEQKREWAKVEMKKWGEHMKECLDKEGYFKSKEHEVRYWKLWGRMTQLAEICGEDWIP